ncbi:restriction endonuclease subunit S [Escherichia coli]|uniref:restriction endonuclease subunit S n=1 Tax=Escherichia coli TaxID=562 RepID=UPI0029C051F4|nr:restriction endonuclease subunit S [Escherichia coli]MDX4990574.1 restriction endonuclease subunit S [Escherichia coli]
MSELSYLEKLLDGVEVEWKMLGEVIHSLKTGLNPRQNFSLNTLDAQGYYVTVREIQNGKVVFLDKTDRVNDRALKIINGRSNLEAGDILFSGTGTVGRIAVIEENPINWNIKEGVYTIKPIKEKIAPRFLSYLLQSSKIVKDYSKKIVGNPVISLPMGDLKKLLIPIPCPDNPEKSLAIQSEIVRILDKFTALTAELTAELNMRKKQYNYYRDQLLSFDNEDVPHLPMGQKDIGEFIRGGTFQKKDFMDAGVGCIHYGQIYTYYGTYTKKTKTHISAALAKKCKKAQKGNLIIATTSENDEDVCKAVAWLGSDDIAVSSDACIYKHNLNPKYVSYYFQTEQFQNQKRQYITGAKVRRVNADNLSKILIPVPSMAVQERIVSILDKFDTLTNSITEGLPREIELRQKQYEYYRDLLFSFPKPETASN